MDNVILQAKKGDEQAVEELVSRYKGMVRSLSNKFYLVGGDKNDLWQEGMIGLFAAINSYDESKGSFPSFAELCILRKILDAVKSDNSFKNKPLCNYAELTTVENVADPTNPLESLLQKEYAEKVAKFIETELTSFEQKALKLFAQGYNYDDISLKLNKSYKSVDGALQRARKKILAFQNSYLTIE